MTDFLPNALEMWYKQHGRNLPWRETKNPYAVWVSEIILQQTRVAQGLEYYNRFMKRFPTVEDLARAHQDEVLKYWQGLGYYSRARNLHAAAQQVVQQGEFPSDYKGIRALKGVGDYTAAAIGSISFGLPVAVVDGNVYRVISRLFGISTPIDTTAGKKEFTRLAQELLDTVHPGLYNQAIMDFGALQCVPKSPDCAACPLADKCQAYATHQVACLPVKSRKNKVSDRYFHYVQVRVGQEMLLHQRPAGDIWQGLYELPLTEIAAHEKPEASAQNPWWGWASKGTLRAVCRDVRHVLSHRILHASLWELKLQAWPEDIPEGFIKLNVNELEDYAVPRLVEILLEKL